MPEELTLVDLGTELAKVAVMASTTAALLEVYKKAGTPSEVEGCRQTLNAALAALEGHLNALKGKANALEE